MIEGLTIELFDDRILISRIKEKGLATPDDADLGEIDRGFVEAVGETKKVQIGDQVVFNHYEKKVKFLDKEYLVIRESNVMIRFKNV